MTRHFVLSIFIEEKFDGIFSVDYNASCDVQHWKKVLLLYANSEGPDEREVYLCLLCSSTFIIVSIDSKSGQRRPRSACANAQADLGLRCPQIA